VRRGPRIGTAQCATLIAPYGPEEQGKDHAAVALGRKAAMCALRALTAERRRQ
jgi:hypothetical protein